MNILKLSVLLLLSSSLHAMHKKVIPMMDVGAGASSSSQQFQGLYGLIPVVGAEDLNMNAIDPLTKRTFQEQADTTIKEKLACIVAMVTVLNRPSTFSRFATCLGKEQSDTYSMYYCNAHALLSHLDNTRSLSEQRDRVRGRPIEAVDFYIASLEEKKFKKIFCRTSDEYWRKFVEANTLGAQNQKDAWDWLGKKYESYKLRGGEPFIKILAAQNHNRALAVHAQYDLVKMFIDEDVDIEKVIILLNQVAEQQEDLGKAAQAQYELGKIYYDKKIDRDKAKILLKKAYRQSIDPAISKDAGECLINALMESDKSEDAVAAFEMLNEFAKQKEHALQAQMFLGKMYYDGRGVDQDIPRALQMLEDVAEQTDAIHMAVKARYELGIIYEERKDYKKAIEMWKKILGGPVFNPFFPLIAFQRLNYLSHDLTNIEGVQVLHIEES